MPTGFGFEFSFQPLKFYLRPEGPEKIMMRGFAKKSFCYR
jgi:hypothetical protein